jgi:hypothetical protein
LNILSYASEEIIVPYFHSVDQKMHRYFPDFVIQTRNLDGSTSITMIEVKPKAQTKRPNIKKITAKNQDQVFTFIKNQEKWQAAKIYCEQRGWKFAVITEDELRV